MRKLEFQDSFGYLRGLVKADLNPTQPYFKLRIFNPIYIYIKNII